MNSDCFYETGFSLYWPSFIFVEPSTMCNVYCMVRVFGKRKNRARVCVSDHVCIDCQWLNPSLADTGSVPDVSPGYDKGIVPK